MAALANVSILWQGLGMDFMFMLNFFANPTKTS
jgi:hypothetical protein